MAPRPNLPAPDAAARPTLLSTDTLDGSFTQFTGSVGVSNVSRTISGYLSVDTMFGDDYESLGASLGVRLHW